MGDLRVQKYATETQITPDNVGKLKVAWQMHTGDVSDGSGSRPSSDWSATPLFVNSTLYIGTPFFRIFALEPDTGKVKGIYDTHALLKALTQPDPKTRGVAYWQAQIPWPVSHARKSSTSGRWTPSCTPSTPTQARSAPASARTAC